MFTESVDHVFPGYRVIGVPVGTTVVMPDGRLMAVTETQGIISGDKLYVNTAVFDKIKLVPIRNKP